MNDYIAFLRGINVGKAKRISMEDLCALVERLGFEDVRAVLNSGNVVFRGKKAAEWMIADNLRESLELRHGFTSHTVILTSTDLDTIIRESPLDDVAEDPSKYLCGFVMDPAVLSLARQLTSEDWGKERIAVTGRAVYIWCPGGVAKSKLVKALDKVSVGAITMRNWSTVLKVQTEVKAR
jgi:uncharacterized protein (DUF1697 family)